MKRVAFEQTSLMVKPPLMAGMRQNGEARKMAGSPPPYVAILQQVRAVPQQTGM
jgi:hypothetical protein